MVLHEGHENYPRHQQCWLCINDLRGPVAMWPINTDGRVRAAFICADCCKSAATRAAKDLRTIEEIREIRNMGFDRGIRGGFGKTLFVPDDATTQ